MCCCTPKTLTPTKETVQKPDVAVASNQPQTAAASCCSSSSPPKNPSTHSAEPELSSTSAS
jgi:hypothetical protein